MWTRARRWTRAWAAVTALVIAAALPGCKALLRTQTVKLSAWNNPRFATVAPAQVQIGPVLDCSGSRSNIVASEPTRTWLAEQFFPAVWQQIGAPATPEAERPAKGSGLCEHLYADWYDGTNYEKEDGGPKLAAIAQAMLGGSGGEHVFVIVFARRSYCAPVKRDLRDANGVVVGSIDTGEESCEENGQIDLAGYLLAADGHLLYMSSGQIEYQGWFEPEDATRAATKFVAKFPKPAAAVAAR